MTDNGENILVGYSGHGRVVADIVLLSGLSLKFYADKTRVESNPLQLEYIGFEQEDHFEGWEQGHKFILGIGDNRIREKAAEIIKSRGEKLLSVIHPAAVISAHAMIGEGTFVGAQATVNSYAKTGDYSILNTNCIVEHDCLLGRCVHIAPGAVLAGNVAVGNRSFVGANAVVKEGVHIGSDVTIGAGTVVIRDVADGKKVVGNPGREI